MRAEVDVVACHRLDRLPGLHRYLLGCAALCAEMAKTFSTDLTGAYDQSLYSELIGSGPSKHARFGASDHKAWWMEFGARRKHNVFRARKPLRKAVRAVGLKFFQTAKG